MMEDSYKFQGEHPLENQLFTAIESNMREYFDFEILKYMQSPKNPAKMIDHTLSRTPFHYAVIQNSEYYVKHLLSTNISINAVDDRRETPLHYANKFNLLKMFEYLIDTGRVNLELMDMENKTIFHRVAQASKFDIVQFMLPYINKLNERLMLSGSFVNIFDKSTFSMKHLYYKSLTNNITKFPGILGMIMDSRMALMDIDMFTIMLNDVEKEVTDNIRYKNILSDLLAKAISNGFVEFTIMLIKTKTLFNQINNNTLRYLHNNNSNVLHLAIQSHKYKYDIVKYIIEETEVDHDSVNSKGYTPLHLAIEYGRDDCVERLLMECNSDVDAKTVHKNTVWHLAVKSTHTYNHDIIFDLLYQFRSIASEFNTMNVEGDTPLYLAFQLNDADILEKLYSHLSIDADETIKLFQRYFFNRTFGNDKCFSFIQPINSSADIYDCILYVSCFIGTKKLVKFCLKNSKDKINIDITTMKGKHKCTPLMYAIQLHKPEFIEYFVDIGANIFAKNAENLTPVDMVFQMKSFIFIRALLHKKDNDLNDLEIIHRGIKTGVPRIVDYLLAYPTINVEERDANGLTPLLLAIDLNAITMVQSLIKSKCNVNVIDGNGSTALHHAISVKSLEILELLLAAYGGGRMINKKNVGGETPLHYAINKKFVNGVKLLWANKECDRTMKFANRSPLHLAVINDSYPIVMFLLETNIDINDKDENSKTPIFYAYQLASHRIINALLNKFPNLSITTGDHRNLLHYTVRRGNIDMIRNLLNTFKRRKIDFDVKNDEVLYPRSPVHALIRNQFHELEQIIHAAGQMEALPPKDHCSLRNHVEAKTIRILKLFLSHGYDINREYDSKDSTLLICALIHDSPLVLQFLLENDVAIDVNNLQIKNLFSDDPKYSKPRAMKYLAFYMMKSFTNDELKDYINTKNLYFIELERMKTTKLGAGLSYFEYCFSDADKYKPTDNEKRKLEATDLNRKFPFYGYMIQMRYRKGNCKYAEDQLINY